MADRKERVVRFVDRELMHVHRSFVLMQRLPSLHAMKTDEAAVVAATAHDPLAAWVEHVMFNESFELVVDDFFDSLPGLPIEDLRSSARFKMVDVANLARAADGEQL